MLTSFPGVGTISYAGDFPSPRTVSTVVRTTGGTGGFQGATATVTIGPGADSAPNIFVVNVPRRLDIHARRRRGLTAEARSGSRGAGRQGANGA